MKTHKIPGIALEQVESGASGITVAKLSEAEVIADSGIEDIFVAYPLVTEAKIRQAVRLAERVIPNHICSTVHLHDVVYLTTEDGVPKEMLVAARGKVW